MDLEEIILLMISIGDFKLSETELTIKDYPPIKTNVELETWTPADISKIEGVPRKFWNNPDANNIQDLGILGKTLRPLLRSSQFQFMLILPNFLIFFMAAVSGFFGTNDASLSLATVLTWIVWWCCGRRKERSDPLRGYSIMPGVAQGTRIITQAYIP